MIEVWIEFDWDAPDAGVRALARYLHSVRAGDPAELAVAAGTLSEEQAAERFMGFMQDVPELAARLDTMPAVAVHAGPVPADVPDHLRIPGPGEGALDVLRSELAPYVAVTPVLNQAKWARTWTPEPGFRHLIIDNASDDDTAKILADRGAEVVRFPDRVGRVENWRRSVQVFLERSDADWMKWIFAGDRLLPGAAGVLDRAIARFPEASLISAAYDWKLPDGNTQVFKTLNESKLVLPGESLQRFILQGNWLGGPVAIALHRDVLGEIDFGLQPWVADWQASMEVARRHPIGYTLEKIGVFDTSRVRYHSAHERDSYTMVQDVSMRYQALQHLRELAPHMDVAELEERMDTTALNAIVTRIQQKQNEAVAPASTRVPFEATTRGGAARARIGAAKKKQKAGRR